MGNRGGFREKGELITLVAQRFPASCRFELVFPAKPLRSQRVCVVVLGVLCDFAGVDAVAFPMFGKRFY
jgi:hypothetical protein